MLVPSCPCPTRPEQSPNPACEQPDRDNLGCLGQANTCASFSLEGLHSFLPLPSACDALPALFTCFLPMLQEWVQMISLGSLCWALRVDGCLCLPSRSASTPRWQPCFFNLLLHWAGGFWRGRLVLFPGLGHRVNSKHMRNKRNTSLKNLLCPRHWTRPVKNGKNGLHVLPTPK